MHLGCGRFYRDGWINVDINQDIRADWYLDISNVPWEKFDLHRQTFDEIEAWGVFEHIQNLVACWENCLAFLKDGGRLRLMVPHDLSYGAWQDPTHVRGFNEMSFKYPTDWCWYLGWHRTEGRRFLLRELTFKFSEWGKMKEAEGLPNHEILLLPRCVDEIHAVLEATSMNEVELEYCRVQAGDVY